MNFIVVIIVGLLVWFVIELITKQSLSEGLSEKDRDTPHLTQNSDGTIAEVKDSISFSQESSTSTKTSEKKKFPFWAVVFSNVAVLVIASSSFAFIMYATKCELTEEQLKIVQRVTIECVENGGSNCTKKAEQEVCNLIDLKLNTRANY